jgi:hypothetical protein
MTDLPEPGSWEVCTDALDDSLAQIELLAGQVAGLLQTWCLPEWKADAVAHFGQLHWYVVVAQAARQSLRQYESAMAEAAGEALH